MTDRVSPLPDLSVGATPDPLQAQFIEITKKDTPPAQGPDVQKSDVGDVLFNGVLAAKLTDYGEGVRDAQAAAKAFVAIPDKAEALAKGGPAFEAAIKQSDADYISAIAKYSPDYDQKRHDVEASQMPVVMAVQGLKEAFTKVPEEKQEEAGHLVALAMDKNSSPALKASVLKEMDQFPGLRKSVEAVQSTSALEEKAVGEMTKAAQPLMHAAYEQAATRYIYAHAMELGGEKGKAYLMKQEGQTKITDASFEFLDKPKPPEPMLKV